VTEDDRAELQRLRAYVEMLAKLIQLHDQTPNRWKYFQTEWLWRYARGMVDGLSTRDVRDTRIAELEADDALDEGRKETELAALRRSQLRILVSETPNS
jgi:hypothetical protein